MGEKVERPHPVVGSDVALESELKGHNVGGGACGSAWLVVCSKPLFDSGGAEGPLQVVA